MPVNSLASVPICVQANLVSDRDLFVLETRHTSSRTNMAKSTVVTVLLVVFLAGLLQITVAGTVLDILYQNHPQRYDKNSIRVC